MCPDPEKPDGGRGGVTSGLRWRRCSSPPRRPHEGARAQVEAHGNPWHFRDDSAGGEIWEILSSGASDAP